MTSNNNDDVYEVEAIVGCRHTATNNGCVEYRVKWRGYSESENTWEPESNLDEGSVEEARAYCKTQHNQRKKLLKRVHVSAMNSRRKLQSNRDEGAEGGDDANYMSDGTYHDQSDDATEKKKPSAAVTVTPSTPPRRPSRGCSSQTNERMRKCVQELSDGEDDGRKGVVRRKIYFESDDDENGNHGETVQPDDDDDDDNRTSRPSRNCSVQTNQRMNKTIRELQSDEESDDEEFAAVRRKGGARRKILESDDDEYENEEETAEQQSDYHRQPKFTKRPLLPFSGLGEHDLYCCPICYNEAEWRRGRSVVCDDEDASGGDDDDDEYEGDVFTFEDDPMTVLENVGFGVASEFCFLRVTGVKQHIQYVHSIDLTELNRNELFKRFEVRGQDGLLQHFVRSNFAYKNDMWGYWRGNYGRKGELFRTLVRLIGRNEEKKPASNPPEFCTSFPNRARKIWEKVSDPFLKRDEEGDKKFIDYKVKEENEVRDNPYFDLPDQEEEDETNSFVEELKRKTEQYKRDRRSDERDNEDEEESSSSDSDESEEELEDPWMKEKEKKMKQKLGKTRTKIQSTGNDSSEGVFQSDVVQA